MIYVIIAEEYDRSNTTLIAYSANKEYAEQVAKLMQQPAMACNVRVVAVEALMG